VIDALPRVGLVKGPSPISFLPALAAELGLAQLSVKRDDLLGGLLGGTKVRKLDYLLATEPFVSAKGLHGIGAIGSGLLAALAIACEQLDKKLVAHCFFEPPDEYVLDNLALIASRAEKIVFYGSRLRMALEKPSLFRRPIISGYAVVPPGATNAAGVIGAVAGALELGDQIKKGVVSVPDVIYVALGSMGTVAGLSIGLALANVRTRIVAVSAIEKTFSKQAKLDAIVAAASRELTKYGVSGVTALRPVPVQIDRSQLGAGYGQPTVDSIAACTRLQRHGVVVEPVYSGKAMAALLAAGNQSGVRHALFWHTRRGAGASVKQDWRARVPSSLRGLVA
jgi:D-cysteine desulfhydrase